MCGIVGIIDLAGAPAQPAVLRAMAGAIAHRGPDDEGFAFVDPEAGSVAVFAGAASPASVRDTLGVLHDGVRAAGSIALGHRRFSIVDLSDAGHQPFLDGDAQCVLVFNGEIYNHLELRAELEALGARFRTHSDTEVVVEAYKQWGTGCFGRFNGFWAIALYDRARRQLLLSRDRIGKKPLFWTRIGQTILFASEIKALLRVPEVHARRRVNEAAAARWLAYGRKDLDEDTFFEGIHTFPAGAWAEVTAGFPRNATRFWTLPDRRMSEADVSVDEAARGVRELLEDAVRLRLQADVPVAVELSGGLDSSTLVALASRISPQQVTTYTVRFHEREWNEEPFARSVAERCGVDYRVLDPPVDSFWTEIRSFTALEEEPYHSPNLQANQLIWAQMRALGTKVSLNGAAGDELFGGYASYYPAAQFENVLHGRFGAYARNARLRSEAGTTIEAWRAPAVAALKAVIRRTMPSLLARVRQPAHVRGLPTAEAPPSPVTLSRALYADMTHALMPYWLVSGDRGFMGVPVEVRAPFLDYRLVEFAYRLPTTYLVRDGWHKWILRKAMEGILPDEVVWRRTKLGFPFPLQRFYAENAPIVDALLDGASNPYIDTRQRASVGGDWRALSFLLWYELYFNANGDLFERLERLAARRGEASPFAFDPHYLRSCA